MKIHTVEYYNEMDFESPEKTAEYFKAIYINRYKEKDEEQIGKLLEKMYSSLSRTKKYIVENLIYDLLSDAKKDKLAGQYFKELLESEDITYSQLALCIAGYIEVSQKCNKLNSLIGKDYEYVKSKLKRLQESNSFNIKNEIIELTAGYFSISPKVLLTGKGIKYSVNWERIEQLPDYKNKETKLFLLDILMSDIHTFTKEKDKKHFIEYVAHSQKTFAELVSNQYNIGLNDILIEEDCWIELEKYPFSAYYNLLGYKEKNILKHAIENIFIKEIK